MIRKLRSSQEYAERLTYQLAFRTDMNIEEKRNLLNETLLAEEVKIFGDNPNIRPYEASDIISRADDHLIHWYKQIK